MEEEGNEADSQLDTLLERVAETIRHVKTVVATGLIRLRGDLLSRPLDVEGALQHYVPLGGVAGYGLTAVTVLNPRLVRNLYGSLGIRYDLTSLYVLTATAGFGLHLYHRPHMRRIGEEEEDKVCWTRIGYCAYLSTISVFGSVLLWAVMARVTPSNAFFRTCLAASSTAAMVKTKLAYLEYLDRAASDPSPKAPDENADSVLNYSYH